MQNQNAKVSDQRQDHVHRTRDGGAGRGGRGGNWRARKGRMWNIKQRVNPADLDKRPARKQVNSTLTISP